MKDIDKMTAKQREAYCNTLRSRIRRGSQLTMEEQKQLKRLSQEFPDGNYANQNFCSARQAEQGP